MKPQYLPPELRQLVHQITEVWGEVIREEAGIATYRKIESLREFLKRFRDPASLDRSIKLTTALKRKMRALTPSQLEMTTHAFSVLLELINLCENAIRSLKIRTNEVQQSPALSTQEIYLVLTAHPTESRAPDVVAILNEIQKQLSRFLYENSNKYVSLQLGETLKPYLRRLWYLGMARREQPRVQDEAEYIYSILFRPENIEALISQPNEKVYVRTWVGGDKDGHPGVDEKVMLKSLQLSRHHLFETLNRFVEDMHNELKVFVTLAEKNLKHQAEISLSSLTQLSRHVAEIKHLKSGDTRRLNRIRKSLRRFEKSLTRPLRRSLSSRTKIHALLETFPCLVVPLELRESSEIFREGPASNPAILRMLKTLRGLCGSSDPRGYARGLIISMTENLNDLAAADVFLQKALGRNYVLPLIPLFERGEDLAHGPNIVARWVRTRRLKKMEVMLGYSDSAKEGGVLPSRIAIRDALLKLEGLQRKIPGLRFTYFHGSGGSVARGGGSLEEQTAHWPRTAFERYKVTIQGEMIQRTFSTPEIFGQYLRKVRALAAAKRRPTKTHPALLRLAAEVSVSYRTSVSDPAFLHMVEEASAYRFLEDLRFGSRPSKRKKLAGVSSLRAIPWILAWTQTRNLLPTWWGFGSAFAKMNPKDKSALKRLANGQDPLFSSYLHQLGFTFAKIEPAIWWMYLDESALTEPEKKKFFAAFQTELSLATKAFENLTGGKKHLWKKPWLDESIRLRAPLIHPLNVAQLTAWKTQNAGLLREASVGIACGMLTTG